MKVNCHSCQKVLNVPDEKIPADKPLTFKCPGCQSPVSVSRPKDDPLDTTQNVQIPMGKPPEDTTNLRNLMESMESEMDMLEEGSRRALIADDGNFDHISKVLRKMQYTISKVDSQKDALDKMEVNEYEVVVLNERFGGVPPDKNAFHMYLEQMVMDRRRKIFVVLLGKDFNTLDNMTALVKSVNMVMNESDFGNFELILKKALNENETFYHIFNRMMIETGREIEL